MPSASLFFSQQNQVLRLFLRQTTGCRLHREGTMFTAAFSTLEMTISVSAFWGICSWCSTNGVTISSMKFSIKPLRIKVAAFLIWSPIMFE